MSYCTVEDVLKLTHSKAKQFGFKGDDADDELATLINDWILQSESLINSYCRRDWYDMERPPFAVTNVCIRLTANMIAFSFGRRDNPLKKIDDWNTGVITSTIFTEDLKEDLKPFRKPRKTHIFKI